jgi:nucleoside-diphosphate-sugar epimerase
MRILITGGTGWTAQPIVDLLAAEGHQLRILDIDSSDSGSAQVVSGDIAEPSAVNSAVADVEVIIHLAIAVGSDDYDSPEVPFKTNVLGTYNVLEAARIRRVAVVLLSSAPVHLTLDPVQARWLSSPDDDPL